MKKHQTLDPSTKKFRLGIFAGDLTQPISLMRHLGPFAAMVKEDSRLELVFPQVVNGQYEVGWTWLIQCDAIFYSHPSTDTDIATLGLAYHMGIPVWSEYVDDLFSVRATNPAYHSLKNKRALKALVNQAIELSAVVTAVSKYCAEAFPHSDRIGVLPEACLWPMSLLPRKKAVSWRGLASHDNDTDGIIDAVCRVAKDFPDWEWTLLGAPTEEMSERLIAAAGKDADGSSMVKCAPYFNTPWQMIHAWSHRAPYLHITPLADDAFNRSKSHLAYLEATAIGAAVIAPDYLPEWRQPGVIQYAGGALAFPGKMDFEAVLRREMLSFKPNGIGGQVGGETNWGVTGGFHPNVQTARAEVYPDRTQPVINQLRWMALRKLASLVKPNREIGAVPAVTDRTLQPFVSRSQIGQDRFVYELLVIPEGLYNGTFLDIGCHQPMEINNTFALEELGWRGILVDLTEYPFMSARKSDFIHADATKINWFHELAQRGFDKTVIDYVSIDVDEAQLLALENLLNAGVRFRVATVEHDGYRFGPERVAALRALMAKHGYTLLTQDIRLGEDGLPFEDWYVDAAKVEPSVCARFVASGKAWEELFTPETLKGERSFAC